MNIRWAALVLIWSAQLAPAQAQPGDRDWVAYRNERYGLFLRYPPDVLQPERTSEAGDGQVFGLFELFEECLDVINAIVAKENGFGPLGRISRPFVLIDPKSGANGGDVSDFVGIIVRAEPKLGRVVAGDPKGVFAGKRWMKEATHAGEVEVAPV